MIALLLAAAVWQAPFSVREDAGIARTAEVVSVGVPLGRESDVRDVSTLGVVDEKGASVASQSRVLARWDAPPDDELAPIRWVLVSVPVTVPARGTARFSVVPGVPAAPADPIASTEDGAIVVSPFEARFTKEEPGPLGIVAQSPSGAKARAGGATSIELEENGPLRAVVVARGELSAGFDRTAGGAQPLLWTARWIFTRGAPSARVLFTIENPDRPFEQPFHDKGEAREKRFARLALEWRGGKGDARAGKSRGDALRVLQSDGARFTVHSGKKRVARGKAAPSWIARDDRVLGMRWFRESAPKALHADRNGLSLEIFPRGGSLHTLQGGRAKTHEVFLATGRDAQRLAGALASPLRGAPDPAWTRDTQALGLLSTEDTRRFGAFEKTLDAAAGVDGAKGATIFDEREAWLGWLDHGDSPRGEPGKFGNNEFDFGWVLLRQWLREPDHDRAFLEAAEATLRHLEDVDVLHTDEDVFWANRGVRKHDVEGTSGHGNVPQLSHFWVRGLVAHHFATGDARAREVAVREIGAWLEARERTRDSGELAWAEQLRDVGWTLVALTDLYELTGDVKWLAYFDRVTAKMVLPNLREDGSMRGASFQSRKDWFAPWQQAYVADGLARRAMIGRRRGVPNDDAERALRSMLGFLCGPAWIEEPATILGRRYPRTLAFEIREDGTKDASEASMSQTVADPAAMGAMLFGDAKLRSCAKASLEHVFPDGPEEYLVPGRKTPAKSAAIKTYFGEAARWLEQTSEGEVPKPRAER